MTSYENRTFREAAKDAGIRGTDWAGNNAIDDFSTYVDFSPHQLATASNP